jgi:iron-sulfur cluster insertion protein
MITLTESARRYLLNQCVEANKPAVKLQVNGGGCAGFSYEYKFEEALGPLDVEIPLDEGHAFVLDGVSVIYVAGTTLDYVSELGGSSLKLVNPNEKASCGCGKSFSI